VVADHRAVTADPTRRGAVHRCAVHQRQAPAGAGYQMDQVALGTPRAVPVDMRQGHGDHVHERVGPAGRS